MKKLFVKAIVNLLMEQTRIFVVCDAIDVISLQQITAANYFVSVVLIAPLDGGVHDSSSRR